MMVFRLVLFAGLSLLGFSGTASAQTCFAFGPDMNFDALTIAEVKQGTKRVNFIEDRCDGGASNPECRMKAFVVPGDLVLIDQVFDTLACAVFVNAKGNATYGLLPNDRLYASSKPISNAPDSFIGEWVRTEASIAVTGLDDGKLGFRGSATFGALDPDRVERGAVNLGAFSFAHTQETTDIGDVIASTEEDSKTLVDAKPAKPGEAGECTVRLSVRGPYLAVLDNGGCGGLNVSFTGVYRRQ
jgi:hypothetical protein